MGQQIVWGLDLSLINLPIISTRWLRRDQYNSSGMHKLEGKFKVVKDNHKNPCTEKFMEYAKFGEFNEAFEE
jgi:hypothetical protein